MAPEKPEKVIVPEEDKPVKPEATPRLVTPQLLVLMAAVAKLLPIVTNPVEVPVLMLVGWLLEAFKDNPPEPERRVVVEVVLFEPS